MELNQIWANFTGRMSEIILFHDAAKESAEKELKLLNDYSNELRANNNSKESFWRFQNMTFINAKTGDFELYDQTNRSLEDVYLHVLLHKNKQYQWLLAEAYEEFEDFLENTYAYYGYINNSFWPMNDYGNISLSELSDKKYEWYAEQARKKKDVPRSILNRFRKQFCELVTIEKQNKLNINLALAITLIEKLRHIIVHKGGKVDSKVEFIKLVTEESGLYNNGKIAQEHKDFINTFFGKNEYENLITILEVRVLPKIPLNFQASLFGELTNFLMAYSFMVYEQNKINLKNQDTF
jgi:hypothetical protein